MKSNFPYLTTPHTSRAPQGARGLKSTLKDLLINGLTVAPRKGRVG